MKRRDIQTHSFGNMAQCGIWARSEGTSGSPYSLNNRGHVVGYSDLAGDQTSHPFLCDKGTLRDSGTLGGSLGLAEGINDAGEVVGVTTNKNDQELAFLWKDVEGISVF